jgi:hypothetical protein
MGVRAFNPNRIAGWLLAITVVLPSLVGWLPMPMRAQAALNNAATSAENATSRLLADLAVLCTPYGLRLAGHDQPGKPAGKLAHDACVLCGLAAGASVGVLQTLAQLAAPSTPILAAPPFSRSPAPVLALEPRPPSRGPPN